MYVRAFLALVILLTLSSAVPCFGLSFTSIVAQKGRKVSLQDGWPKGVGGIVNDDTRTTGWNSFFSEWPNDVQQFAMEVASMDDVNRLVTKLAAVECEEKII